MQTGVPRGAENPLLSDNPVIWDELLEEIGPASLIAATEYRISARLKRAYDAEDVWQEALMLAWRDRRQIEWRGPRAFRGWMLSIIENRILDLAKREGAERRGGDKTFVSIDAGQDSRCGENLARIPPRLETTTQVRRAVYREQAAFICEAIETLPDDVRDVVRLRLIEQQEFSRIGEELGLGVSNVQHRFRKGARMYRDRLRHLQSTRSLAPRATNRCDG